MPKTSKVVLKEITPSGLSPEKHFSSFKQVDEYLDQDYAYASKKWNEFKDEQVFHPLFNLLETKVYLFVRVNEISVPKRLIYSAYSQLIDHRGMINEAIISEQNAIYRKRERSVVLKTQKIGEILHRLDKRWNSLMNVPANNPSFKELCQLERRRWFDN